MREKEGRKSRDTAQRRPAEGGSASKHVQARSNSTLHIRQARVRIFRLYHFPAPGTLRCDCFVVSPLPPVPLSGALLHSFNSGFDCVFVSLRAERALEFGGDGGGAGSVEVEEGVSSDGHQRLDFRLVLITCCNPPHTLHAIVDPAV